MILASRPSDERVRELATEILSNPPFERWRAADIDVIERFARWISEYLDWMHHIRLEAPGLFWFVLLALLGVTLALLAHIIWSVRIALSAPLAESAAESINESPRWAEEAERLAQSGRFLEASHRLALGSVHVLVEQEHIELGRSDANRILRRRVRDAPLPRHLSSEFLHLLDAFEQQWFRDRIDDPELYRAWRDFHSRLSAVRGDRA